jgi:hypothetical protein
MKRRTLLQSFVAVLVVQPLARLRLVAQSAAQSAAQPAGLTSGQVATLRAVAEVVLPASIGRAGRDDAVDRFVSWVRNYREGADRGHGYGASTLSAPTGPSPAARYPAQFAALDAAAVARGAASFAALAIGPRRAVIEAVLNTPQPVTRLPARPTGANLVADLMGFFFNSPEGFDLAYAAAIGRDACRGLPGSDHPPDPLRIGGD